MNTMPCILASQHVNSDLSQTRDLDFPLSSSCKKVQRSSRKQRTWTQHRFTQEITSGSFHISNRVLQVLKSIFYSRAVFNTYSHAKSIKQNSLLHTITTIYIYCCIGRYIASLALFRAYIFQYNRAS
jgi:hypothetical protein